MDGNDFLMGGGVPSARFPVRGTRVAGRVLAAPVTRQQTDMATKEPKFFKNGDPMMSVVVRIQTDERDPAREGDDGERACYIKGKGIKALRETVKAAGAKRIEPGGFFSMTWVDSELPTGGLPEGQKIYRFEYVPPNPLDTPTGEETRPMPDWAQPQTQPSEPPRGASTAVNETFAGLTDAQKKHLAELGFKVQ